MKSLLAIVILGAVLLAPCRLHAQNYSINWHTIAGGGGTSSGTNGTSTFSVSGTIGQAATATLSGGNYTVTGGFWSIMAAVQTPGAPFLTITNSGAQSIISWSASANGFVLEKSSSLTSGSWSLSPMTLTTNNGTISATVPSSSGYQFFRLHNP